MISGSSQLVGEAQMRRDSKRRATMSYQFIKANDLTAAPAMGRKLETTRA
jgi:hypothetical protein